MAGKNRGNGEGTVTQRKDGRWEARLTLSDGRGRKSLYGKTRAEAARRLASAIRDQDRGVSFAHDERQTLATYLPRWLQTLRPPVLKPRTWQRYESDVRMHLIPALGRTRLVKLSAQQVQALYAAKLSEEGGGCRRAAWCICTRCCMPHCSRPSGWGWCRATSAIW